MFPMMIELYSRFRLTFTSSKYNFDFSF